MRFIEVRLSIKGRILFLKKNLNASRPSLLGCGTYFIEDNRIHTAQYSSNNILCTIIPYIHSSHLTLVVTQVYLRSCLPDEIESVHEICRMTDSVDRSYFGSKRPY